MSDKQKIAKWLFVAGVLAFVGTVATASLSGRPITLGVTIAMMVPYLAVQYRKGKASVGA